MIATLLLTGGAGTLGRVLTPPLSAICSRLLVSDLGPALATLPPPAHGETRVACDLADRGAMRELLSGVQAVVHLGGVSVEMPFDVVLPANIVGLFNLYEAARLAGTRRIVFASSNHVTGCYGRDQRITPTDPPRPDGYYGLSKLYGEGMASLYHDRYGIESVCLRIGSAVPEPDTRRALSSWLSLPDLARLVIAALSAPDVGFTVAYGMSDNARAWWDTRSAWERLGYQPQDRAEDFAARVESIDFPPGTPQARLQGGSFLGRGPFDDPPEETAA